MTPPDDRIVVLVEAVVADETALALLDRWLLRNRDKVVARRNGVPAEAVLERHRIATRLAATLQQLDEARKAQAATIEGARETLRRLGLPEDFITSIEGTGLAH